jgi:hypothetical protein
MLTVEDFQATLSFKSKLRSLPRTPPDQSGGKRLRRRSVRIGSPWDSLPSAVLPRTSEAWLFASFIVFFEEQESWGQAKRAFAQVRWGLVSPYQANRAGLRQLSLSWPDDQYVAIKLLAW